MVTPPTLIPTWRKVLKEAELPEAVVIIDFEQYFTTEYSLRKISTWEYVTDERYEELGRSIMHIPAGENTGKIEWSWGDDPSPLIWLQAEYGQDLQGCTVVAHNLAYDGLILYHKYGIKIPHAVDILGLARHDNSQAANDLDSIAKRLGFPPKGKTSEFKDLRRADFFDGAEPNEQGRALGEYANRDVEIEEKAFKHYLTRWSNPRTEAQLMRHTLEMFWNPVLNVDYAAAAEIKPQMQTLLQDAIAASGHTKTEISGNNSFRDLVLFAVERAGDDPAEYVKYGKPKKDGSPNPLLAAAKSDPAREKMLNHPSEEVRNLMAARVAIKSWPNHIKRIDRIVGMSNAAGGLLPVPLKYHGAHTGRWSGGEKINLQNLGSRGDPLITRVRNMLIAPPGHKLVVVDASAIEARVLAWLAGQDDLVQRFREGADVYCEFAARVLGRPVQKAQDNDPGPIAKWRTWARNSVGKVGILGCGYGMGGDKTEAYSGYTITNETAHAIVRAYRSTNPRIVKFWHSLERRFKAAARHGEPGTLLHGVRIYKDGDDTCMRLPSGRIMRYHDLRVRVNGKYSDLVIPNPDRKGAPTYTWGGTLAENITQAVARDILAEAVLATEQKGYRVAHHCHDEIIACVPEARAVQALNDIADILSEPPAWAAGCPLDADRKPKQIMQRYDK